MTTKIERLYQDKTTMVSALLIVGKIRALEMELKKIRPQALVEMTSSKPTEVGGFLRQPSVEAVGAAHTYIYGVRPYSSEVD